VVKKLGRRVHSSVVQGWGKVRRFCLAALRPGLVRNRSRLRKGECVRCGACCRLIFRCPALHFLPDGSASCRYHQVRPMNCRVFPIDERDLTERDLVMPERACGFYFADALDPAEMREAGG